MGFLSSLRISASGLTGQRLRMDVIASNVANAETTRTPEGGPYLRQRVVFEPLLAQQLRADDDPAGAATPGRGLRVSALDHDRRAIRTVHDPNHPDADADGNLRMPDIDVVSEMTDLLSASRAYEANVTALNAAKAMALKALDIGRG
jgi:flagellar basal-body rod protein FlgC